MSAAHSAVNINIINRIISQDLLAFHYGASLQEAPLELFMIKILDEMTIYSEHAATHLTVVYA